MASTRNLNKLRKKRWSGVDEGRASVDRLGHAASAAAAAALTTTGTSSYPPATLLPRITKYDTNETTPLTRVDGSEEQSPRTAAAAEFGFDSQYGQTGHEMHAEDQSFRLTTSRSKEASETFDRALARRNKETAANLGMDNKEWAIEDESRESEVPIPPRALQHDKEIQTKRLSQLDIHPALRDEDESEEEGAGVRDLPPGMDRSWKPQHTESDLAAAGSPISRQSQSKTENPVASNIFQSQPAAQWKHPTYRNHSYSHSASQLVGGSADRMTSHPFAMASSDSNDQLPNERRQRRFSWFGFGKARESNTMLPHVKPDGTPLDHQQRSPNPPILDDTSTPRDNNVDSKTQKPSEQPRERRRLRKRSRSRSTQDEFRTRMPEYGVPPVVSPSTTNVISPGTASSQVNSIGFTAPATDTASTIESRPKQVGKLRKRRGSSEMPSKASQPVDEEGKRRSWWNKIVNQGGAPASGETARSPQSPTQASSTYSSHALRLPKGSTADASYPPSSSRKARESHVEYLQAQNVFPRRQPEQVPSSAAPQGSSQESVTVGYPPANTGADRTRTTSGWQASNKDQPVHPALYSAHYESNSSDQTSINSANTGGVRSTVGWRRSAPSPSSLETHTTNSNMHPNDQHASSTRTVGGTRTSGGWHYYSPGHRAMLPMPKSILKKTKAEVKPEDGLHSRWARPSSSPDLSDSVAATTGQSRGVRYVRKEDTSLSQTAVTKGMNPRVETLAPRVAGSYSQMRTASSTAVSSLQQDDSLGDSSVIDSDGRDAQNIQSVNRGNGKMFMPESEHLQRGEPEDQGLAVYQGRFLRPPSPPPRSPRRPSAESGSPSIKPSQRTDGGSDSPLTLPPNSDQIDLIHESIDTSRLAKLHAAPEYALDEDNPFADHQQGSSGDALQAPEHADLQASSQPTASGELEDSQVHDWLPPIAAKRESMPGGWMDDDFEF